MTQHCQDQKDLYRLQYREGQLLQSRDLSSQVESAEQLRWWHNRAVHHAYGILHGYDAKTIAGEIVVKPGLAYDCFGRPLGLSSAMKVPAPSDCGKKSGTVVLFIYSPWAEGHVKGSRVHATCSERFGKGCTELAPVHFAWKPFDEFSVRDGVGVAIATLDNSGHVGQLTQECLPRACTDRRPSIVNGETLLGHTRWEVWDEEGGVANSGVQVKVDVSSAGFTRKPIYIVQTAPFVVPLASYVTDVSDSWFTFRVVVPVGANGILSLGFSGNKNEDIRVSWLRKLVHIKWIGLEPVA